MNKVEETCRFFVLVFTQWQLLDQGYRFMVIESNHISLYVSKYTKTHSSFLLSQWICVFSLVLRINPHHSMSHNPGCVLFCKDAQTGKSSQRFCRTINTERFFLFLCLVTQMSLPCYWVMLPTYHRRLQATSTPPQNTTAPQQTCRGKIRETLSTKVRDVSPLHYFSVTQQINRSFPTIPEATIVQLISSYRMPKVIWSQIFVFVCSAFD